MARIIVTHKVEDVARWKAFDDERSSNLGAFGTGIESYTDADGGNTVGVGMTVTDRDGLETFMQSETCEAIMRRHGVIKPIMVLSDGR